MSLSHLSRGIINVHRGISRFPKYVLVLLLFFSSRLSIYRCSFHRKYPLWLWRKELQTPYKFIFIIIIIILQFYNFSILLHNKQLSVIYVGRKMFNYITWKIILYSYGILPRSSINILHFWDLSSNINDINEIFRLIWYNYEKYISTYTPTASILHRDILKFYSFSIPSEGWLWRLKFCSPGHRMVWNNISTS